MSYDYIADMLSSREYARTRDVALFKLWEEGKITTYKAVEQFLKNNRQPQAMYINVRDFELWLNSLGYRRNNG